MLEKKSAELAWDPTWVFMTLLEIGIPFSVLHGIYDRLFKAKVKIDTTATMNHGQKSLGQSEHNFSSMRFTGNVVKSSAVVLQIHFSSPLPTQYNVERSKELCLDGFNTVCGVGGGGRDVEC